MKKICAIAIGSLVLLSAICFIFGADLRIAYHRRQMKLNYDATFSNDSSLGQGFVGFVLGEEYDNYEYHREKLVKLGAIHRRSYTLRHNAPGSEKHRALWMAVQQRDCPEFIDSIGDRIDNGKPWAFTVWCDPKFTSMWEDFVASRDTAEDVGME